MKKQTEKGLQKAIIDYLRLRKYLVVKFPSVGIWVEKTKSYIRQPQKGISDLLVCSPIGEFIAIEVKVKPNRLSKQQVDFIDDVLRHRGNAFVAYSLEDVINNL